MVNDLLDHIDAAIVLLPNLAAGNGAKLYEELQYSFNPTKPFWETQTEGLFTP